MLSTNGIFLSKKEILSTTCLRLSTCLSTTLGTKTFWTTSIATTSVSAPPKAKETRDPASVLGNANLLL